MRALALMLNWPKILELVCQTQYGYYRIEEASDIYSVWEQNFCNIYKRKVDKHRDLCAADYPNYHITENKLTLSAVG
jgi:hypothetical protein